MKQGQLIIAVLLVCAIIPFSACDGHNRSVNITSTCLQDNHPVCQLIKGRDGRDGSTGRDIVADVEMFWSKTGRQFQRRGNLLK